MPKPVLATSSRKAPRRHPLVVGVDLFGVARREFRDLGLGASAAGDQIVVVVQRKEILRQPVDDP
jgi:hypothetical protein